MKEVFLARLPILDCNQGLVAYELLFRTGDDISVEIEDNSAASANVIIDTNTVWLFYKSIQRSPTRGFYARSLPRTMAR